MHEELVGVAGPPAAAFGKHHHRPAQLVAQTEQPVLLLVVHRALRAGEHGVVIGDDGRSGALRAEQRSVDGAETGDDAVGRRVAQQLVHRAAAALRGDGQRAVFDEAAGVAQILDIGPRGAAALRVPLGDGFVARRVACQSVARDHLGEVGADRVEIGRRFMRNVVLAKLTRFEIEQRLAGGEHLAFRGNDKPHRAGERRSDDMLHLHRFRARRLADPRAPYRPKRRRW